jgi:3-oxoacyl-[acyl-carrier protein] reductase
MHLDLSGRVVVVTGAAQGIGRVIAQTFQREGCHVVGIDLDAARLADFDLGLACDITDAAAVAETVAEIDRRFGRIDVLVNNAGINVVGEVEALDPAAWDRCFDVNVGGTFRMCQAVLPIMKRQESGRIINAASFAAIIPSIGAAAYGASKAAVVQFTRVLAGELGPWNVTVNAYAPGMIPSAMNGFAEKPQEEQDELLDTLTLRRWGTPEEVADLLVFVASDAARYITGTLLDVSGGKFATQLPQRAHGR